MVHDIRQSIFVNRPVDGLGEREAADSSEGRVLANVHPARPTGNDTGAERRGKEHRPQFGVVRHPDGQGGQAGRRLPSVVLGYQSVAANARLSPQQQHLGVLLGGPRHRRAGSLIVRPVPEVRWLLRVGQPGEDDIGNALL